MHKPDFHFKKKNAGWVDRHHHLFRFGHQWDAPDSYGGLPPLFIDPTSTMNYEGYIQRPTNHMAVEISLSSFSGQWKLIWSGTTITRKKHGTWSIIPVCLFSLVWIVRHTLARERFLHMIWMYNTASSIIIQSVHIQSKYLLRVEPKKLYFMV